MKLSIIIPAYNVEKYISNCLDSILKSNLTSYEIILIDDGSTDMTSLICEEYIRKNDKIIKIFKKENGGASSARNLGLEKATGDYVWFIDGDDFIDYNINYDFINSLNADFIQFKMCYFYENGKIVKLKNIENNIESNDMNKYISNGVINSTLSVSPCDKIIKRKVLINNNIFFKLGIVGEDIDWSLKLYLYAKSFMIYNYEIYYYRQNRENSVTSNITDDYIESLLYILDYWIKFNYVSESIRKSYMNYLAYQYILIITFADLNKFRRQIYEYMFLLDFADNYKVKLSKICIKCFGVKITQIILKFYNIIKAKGILKI